MATWLFNSSGEPIAFIKEDKVFSANADFIGRLDGDEVWHGRYKGEIYRENRFLYKTSKGSVVRGTPGHAWPTWYAGSPSEQIFHQHAVGLPRR